jgi:YHS domain-containing protein
MKNRTIQICMALAAILVAGSLWAAEQAPAPKPQTTCPVSGNPIDKKIYVDHEGYRIYFCCDKCPPAFKKDPDIYMKKFQEEGVTLEKAPVAQTTCPILGNPIDKKAYTDYQGKRIYFCCKGCIPEFSKDPAKYVKQLEDKGVVLEKAPEPVTK